MLSTKLKKLSGAMALIMLAVLIIAILLCVSAPFSFAEESSNVESLDVDYITENYYNFGEIVAISSSDNGFSDLEIIDGALFLRVISTNSLIPLNNTQSENFHKAEIVSFNDRIFVKQEDGIYIYIIGESPELVKYLDLTYDYTVDDEPAVGEYKSFGGANKDNVLIVDYTSIIVFFDITKDSSLTAEEKRINSVTVTSVNSFDRMVVENNTQGIINLHLYDSKTGNKFTRLCEKRENGRYSADVEKTQNGLDVFENKDLYTYFNGGICLKADGLYQNDAKVIEIASSDSISPNDAVIHNFSRMSVGGEKLYVVDNAQHAVKAYDSQYNLIELYGSEGDGLTDNANGLTRFRNPKFLSYGKECLALFDEGNKRIVTLDYNGNVINHKDVENVLGLAVFEGIWYITDKEIVKLSFDMETVLEIESENILISIITDKTNVFVKSSDGVYKVKNSKLELIEDLSVNDIFGGKHDGVMYSVGSSSFTMLKDGKEIISENINERSYFAIDFQGNVIYGKDNNLTLLTRKLNGFDTKPYTTDITINELVITDHGTVFALSENALVKLDYIAVSSETIFERPSKSYPYKAIEVNGNISGYTRPDNYESVVEVETGSFILFAITEYADNKFYFTELLRDGKYIDLYIPEQYATISESVTEENKYIKYGGTDANPCAYEYPSNSALPVCNIDKESSYQVIRLISNDWHWYELEIDGKKCYVNAGNYISAEPPYITVERYYMRAKADAFGQTIPLYASPDAQSQIIATVGEGYVLELTEQYNKDNEFLQVRYNKGIAYVKTSNIQKDGLTEGQKFALGFAGAVVGITAIFGTLSLIIRRRKPE